jgi:hypothetical protein
MYSENEAPLGLNASITFYSELAYFVSPGETFNKFESNVKVASSVENGRDFFWHLCRNNQTFSMHYSGNPYVQDKVKRAKEALTEEVFKREYEFCFEEKNDMQALEGVEVDLNTEIKGSESETTNQFEEDQKLKEEFISKQLEVGRHPIVTEYKEGIKKFSAKEAISNGDCDNHNDLFSGMVISEIISDDRTYTVDGGYSNMSISSIEELSENKYLVKGNDSSADEVFIKVSNVNHVEYKKKK